MIKTKLQRGFSILYGVYMLYQAFVSILPVAYFTVTNQREFYISLMLAQTPQLEGKEFLTTLMFEAEPVIASLCFLIAGIVLIRAKGCKDWKRITVSGACVFAYYIVNRITARLYLLPQDAAFPFLGYLVFSIPLVYGIFCYIQFRKQQ